MIHDNIDRIFHFLKNTFCIFQYLKCGIHLINFSFLLGIEYKVHQHIILTTSFTNDPRPDVHQFVKVVMPIALGNKLVKVFLTIFPVLYWQLYHNSLGTLKIFPTKPNIAKNQVSVYKDLPFGFHEVIISLYCHMSYMLISLFHSWINLRLIVLCDLPKWWSYYLSPTLHQNQYALSGITYCFTLFGLSFKACF